MKIAILNHGDSFTYNIADLYCKEGAEVTVYEEGIPALDHRDIDLWVLSPGPGTASDTTRFKSSMELIKQNQGLVPIFGVCLGAQLLGLHLGLRLRKIAPVHGRLSEVFRTSTPSQYFSQPAYLCMRYHSWVLEESSEQDPLVRVTLVDEDQQIMAFEHSVLPIVGVQFHPESIATVHHRRLIRETLRIIK